MNQAVFGDRPYLRSISLAATPFLFAHISAITMSQVRSSTWVPWKRVLVSAENCLRQSPHFQTRRSETLPWRLFRPSPFGFR